MYSKLSVAQLIRFLGVRPAHSGSCSRLAIGDHIFLDLFEDFRRYFSVVGDVPVDSEVSVVTSLILRFASLVFRGTHMNRVCMTAFIGECVCMYVSVYVCNMFQKKMMCVCVVVKGVSIRIKTRCFF